jgi:hypothetical protein
MSAANQVNFKDNISFGASVGSSIDDVKITSGMKFNFTCYPNAVLDRDYVISNGRSSTTIDSKVTIYYPVTDGRAKEPIGEISLDSNGRVSVTISPSLEFLNPELASNISIFLKHAVEEKVKAKAVVQKSEVLGINPAANKEVINNDIKRATNRDQFLSLTKKHSKLINKHRNRLGMLSPVNMMKNAINGVSLNSTTSMRRTLRAAREQYGKSAEQEIINTTRPRI